MANTSVRFGFKHVGNLGGSSPNFQQSHRLILSTYSTAIGFGDPVSKVNSTSQYIQRADPAANATSPIVGIFAGCNPTYAAVGFPQWYPGWSGNAAAADTVAYVIDDPNALFLVATYNTAIATASIGNTVNFTGGTPYTTGAMISTAVVDQATLNSSVLQGTASILPFKVVDLYQGIGNGSDPTTAYNWVLVTFNNEIWKTGSGL